MGRATPVATPGARIRTAEARSADRSRAATLFVAVLPLLIVTGGVASALAGHRAWFSEEDGLAENLQVVFLLGAMVGAVLVARARNGRGERLLALAYSGLAIACFFVAGEEVSWGQRLLGIPTPPELAAHNIQRELTLHNTYLLTPVFSLAQIALGLGLATAPFLPWRRLVPARWDGVRRALVPRPALAAYFAPTGLWRIYRTTMVTPGTPPWVGELSEIVELVLYLGVLLFVLGQLRAVRSEAAAGAASCGHRPPASRRSA